MVNVANAEKEKISKEKEAEIETLRKSLNEQTERATKEKADLQAEINRLGSGGGQAERLQKEKAELQAENTRLKSLEIQLNQLTAFHTKAVDELKQVMLSTYAKRSHLVHFL